MAQTTISELTATTIQSNNDCFVIDNADSITKKVLWGSIVDRIITNHITAGSNVTLSRNNHVITISAGESADAQKWYITDTEPDSPNEEDIWLNTDETHFGNIYTYTNSEWTYTTNMKGADGQNGSDGVTPHIDNTSKNWFIGDTDTGVLAEGTNGSDGAAATIDLGTVTTGEPGSNVIITNSGTSSAAVFNFTIPRGENGTNGTDGTNGSDGASISFATNTITGGHSVTISSTDPNVSDTTFNVMDGTEIIQTSSDNRTATLTVLGWQGASAPYTQTVTVSGMTSSVVPIIGLAVSSTVETGIEEQKQWSYVTKATSGTDSITFSCYKTKPTVALTVNIKAV